MEQQAKFQIQDMLPIALTIIVTGIGLAYGLSVLGDVQDDMTAESVEANATGDALEAVAKFPAKLGLIVTVVVAAILIGILIRYFMNTGGK